jgi:hypothetical protein
MVSSFKYTWLATLTYRFYCCAAAREWTAKYAN